MGERERDADKERAIDTNMCLCYAIFIRSAKLCTLVRNGRSVPSKCEEWAKLIFATHVVFVSIQHFAIGLAWLAVDIIVAAAGVSCGFHWQIYRYEYYLRWKCDLSPTWCVHGLTQPRGCCCLLFFFFYLRTCTVTQRHISVYCPATSSSFSWFIQNKPRYLHTYTK